MIVFTGDKITKLLCLFLLLYAFRQNAQISSQRFEKDLSISSQYLFYNGKIISTKDSGYCVAEHHKTSNEFRALLTRFDKFGNIIWSNNYRHVTDSALETVNILKGKEGGFIIFGGISKSNTQSTSFIKPFISKIDSAGNVLWTRIYPPLNGMILSACEMTDSTIVLMLSYYATSNPMSVLQKVSKNGIILWSKKTTQAFLIKEKPNGNILGFGSGATIVIKEFDKYGNDVAEKAYTNPNCFFNGWSFDINKKGEVAVISTTMDSTASTSESYYVLKLNSNGGVIFSNTYSSSDDSVYYQTFSGGFSKDCGIYLNTRFTRFYDIEHNGMLKLDGMGNIEWHKVYNSPTHAFANDIINTPDYGYALLTHYMTTTNFYARIVKTDVLGKTACNNDSLVNLIKTNVPLSIDSTLHATLPISIYNLKDFVLKDTVMTSLVTHCSDQIVYPNIELCDTAALTTGINEILHASVLNEIKIFPNPFVEEFTINFAELDKSTMLEMYNSLGQLVYNVALTEKETKIYVPQNLISGIYYLKVNSSKGNHSLKIIKQ
ncbi:MAG: T9SS type A sorting domain-containing protein [Bacteroidia bacterium]